MDRTPRWEATVSAWFKNESISHQNIVAVDVRVDDDPKFCFRSSVSEDQLMDMKRTVKKLMEPGKGILAIDEMESAVKSKLQEAFINIGTFDKRRDAILAFIEGCQEVNADVSGILFHAMTLTQLAGRTKPVAIWTSLEETQICFGVRVDSGVQTIGGTFGEVTSCGLDALPATCQRLKDMGVEFAEWKYPLTLSEYAPSVLACQHSAYTVSRFASISQTHGLVPVISIEIQNESPDNDLDLRTTLTVMQEVLATLVKALSDHHVRQEALILRMTAPCAAPSTLNNSDLTSFQQLAMGTWIATTRTLPACLGGMALADAENLDSSLNILNELNLCPCFKPFPVTYLWGRALSEGDMPRAAKMDSSNKHTLEVIDWLKKKLKMCCLASMGQFSHTTGSLFVNCISSFLRWPQTMKTPV